MIKKNSQRLFDYVNALENQDEITEILTLIIFAIIVGMIIQVVIQIVKNKKKKNSWIKTIAVGDGCNFHAIKDTNQLDNLIITKIDGDKVTLELVTYKKWISPPTPPKSK